MPNKSERIFLPGIGTHRSVTPAMKPRERIKLRDRAVGLTRFEWNVPLPLLAQKPKPPGRFRVGVDPLVPGE